MGFSAENILSVVKALSAVEAFQTDKIGAYVIVRCRDAGVHAGILTAMGGRSCTLKEARRLWYWKPKQGAWLSAVSVYGLDDSSKIGAPIDLDLTETCEIIRCSHEAAISIAGIKTYEPE